MQNLPDVSTSLVVDCTTTKVEKWNTPPVEAGDIFFKL
jgi:hypothetical protein